MYILYISVNHVYMQSNNIVQFNMKTDYNNSRIKWNIHIGMYYNYI